MKSFRRYIIEGKGGAEDFGKMELIKTDERKHTNMQRNFLIRKDLI